MKIFIGTEDIASLLSDLAFGFKELGYQVTTYASAKNKFYATHKYDIVRGTLINDIIHYWDWKFLPKRLKDYFNRLDNLLTIPYLKWKNKKLIEEHDLFIFIWRPWLHESYLFPLLKKKGKKIICLHAGSDVRHISAFQQQYNIDTSGWEDVFKTDDLNSKINKIRYQELYCDLIYSVPDQAGLYLRAYKHLRLPLNKEKNIQFKIPARKIPVIVHVPSKGGIKGTHLINQTVDKLKKDGYELDYRFIQGIPNKKLLEILTEADILCDELFLHGPGVLSAEAMAAGCAVATNCLNVYPFQPPVCSVTPETIYEKLKLLITDIDYRVALATAGKRFVEEYNNPAAIAAEIIKDLANDSKEDYKPDFFIKRFQLPTHTHLKKNTRALTQQVIDKYGLHNEAVKYELKKRGLI